MKDKDIRDLLNYDSLHEAEKFTGKSYKTDKFTKAMGFITHIEHGYKKRKLLESLGDSTFSNTEENYLKIVKSIGFESVLTEPFINKDGTEERLHVMWNKNNSILLVFDTYTCSDTDGSFARAGREVPPPSVNGGRFYYNWSQNTDSTTHCTSSRGCVTNGDGRKSYSHLFNDDLTPHILPERLRLTEPKFEDYSWDDYQNKNNIWTSEVKSYIKDNKLRTIYYGYHDCREAIKFNISQLNKNGKFLKKWVKSPFLWILHYMDTKEEGYDHEKITSERFNKLPKYVIDSINYNN